MSDIVAAHLVWMKGERYSQRTRDDRAKVLHLANKRFPRGLDDVYQHEIEAFLDTPTWTRWTVHTYYSHLAGFYRWAMKVGWDEGGYRNTLTLDPTADIKPPPCGVSRPKPITGDDIRRALMFSDDPWLACVWLAAGAGLRAAELAEIRREDVTEEFVHVRNGKGGKERYVDTCTSLWTWAQAQPSGLLVRRPYGRAVTAKWLSSAQRAHWTSIGLPHVHLHRLRHTFCTTMWRAAGRDPLVIRDLMGHASVTTTQGYAEPDRSQYRNAVSALDAVLGEGPAGR
jgi:integrase